MNWDTIEGNWKQLAGQTKAQWGKLTGDDLSQIAGRRDQLLSLYQKGKDKQWDQVHRIDWDEPVDRYDLLGMPEEAISCGWRKRPIASHRM